MARTFGLHIWASEKPFYDGECESLVIPSVDGKYGIMAGHSDLITAIVPGELKFTVPGKSPQIAAVSEGIMKIENNNVLVLVETIERPEEIDANRAAAAAARDLPALPEFGRAGNFFCCGSNEKCRFDSRAVASGAGRMV